MLAVKLAIRNLFRQRLRSLVSLSAVSFGVVALLLAGGFVEWIFYAMRRDTIHSLLGHIQVARPGFFELGSGDPFAYLLPKESNEQAEILSIPGVKLLAPRLSFGGLISHSEATVSFLAEGVDPEKERDLSRYLTVSYGKNLSSTDPRGVILGEGLADSLGVKPGDRVALLVNTSTGGVNAVECQIRGLFYTLSKPYDDVALRLPIATARELLRVSGAHTWVLLLTDNDAVPRVLDQLKKRFVEEPSRLEFRSWRDLADFYNKTVTLYSRQMAVLEVIIGLVVILSISNTMTMSVLERTAEIGTLMAMGTKQKKILALFISEGLLLGVIGGFTGIGLGLLLAKGISHFGIPMPPAPGMTHGFTAEILISGRLAINAMVLGLVTCAIASIAPAWRASRLRIVEALRHNR